ncbi:MAG: FAD-binding oxidoreductase, partial [Pseudomonadota bacterium]
MTNAVESLANRFRHAFPSPSVLFDPAGHASFARDWSTAPGEAPALVLRPATVEELSGMVRICAEAQAPIALQGGLTGLAGGAAPRRGEVALTTRRMNRIERVDPEAMLLIAEAGVTLEEAEAAANAAGCSIPIDIGSRGSCTLGGLAATNAGGNRVIRYGVVRDVVAGLEAVTAEGAVVGGLNEMRKNNAGYDLKHLFIGSEGTLGVIARLALRMTPKVSERACAACAVKDFADLIDLLSSLRRDMGDVLESFEVLWDDYIAAIGASEIDVRLPFCEAHPLVAIVEIAGRGVSGRLEAALTRLLEDGVIADAVISQSETQRLEIWRLRDAIGDLFSGLSSVIAFDVSLPLRSIDAFVTEAKARIAADYPDADVITFGHIGDGNIHFSVTPPPTADAHAIEGAVLAIAGRLGGSITGEHGVGVLKKDYLRLCRSETDIALMAAIK